MNSFMVYRYLCLWNAISCSCRILMYGSCQEKNIQEYYFHAHYRFQRFYGNDGDVLDTGAIICYLRAVWNTVGDSGWLTRR